MDKNIFIKIYTADEKKRLVYKMQQLKTGEKSKKHYINLFKIFHKDGAKYTENNYGIHINMSKVSNEALAKVDAYIKNVVEKNNNDKNSDSSSVRNEFVPYATDEFNEYKKKGIKLSKYEKKIIKRQRYNDNVNDPDSDIVYRNYNTKALTDSSANADSTSPNEN